MTKNLWMLVACFAISACTGSDDLQEYVAQVKARPPQPVEPLPVVKPFVAKKYHPSTERTPFAEPQPELVLTTAKLKKDCVQPDLLRKKQPLEQFSLDNLTMQGTLGEGVGLWALILSQEGEVYRVSVGQYMGLNHGRVTKINPDSIELLEYVPDGSGCWTKRTTKLNILVAQ